VIVRDLFQNVPARLRFLKGARTESAHLAQLTRRYAVAYPQLKIGLTLEGHLSFQTSGSGSVERALAEVYGLPYTHGLLPFGPLDVAGAEISGVLGGRALSQSGRAHLMLFVNGRWVQSQELLAALELGYRAVLPKGRHPLAAIHIRVAPDMLDANIHPTKAEGKLLHAEEICAALTAAIRDALGQSVLEPPEEPLPGPGTSNQFRLPLPKRRRGLPFITQHDALPDEARLLERGILGELAPLAQIRQTLILAEDQQGGLYLVDQHRAHERIIYEHLRHRLVGQPGNVSAPLDNDLPDDTVQWDDGLPAGQGQLLLEPVVVELAGRQAALLEERLPALAALGFACERFGGRSFLIRSVPALAEGEALHAHLPALASEAAEDAENWQDRFCAAVACHAALKRGKVLALGEQRDLLARLRQTSAPAVCPHGIPVLLHYSQRFLIRQFGW
jgi:DNA mismatch repair protein MutL